MQQDGHTGFGQTAGSDLGRAAFIPAKNGLLKDILGEGLARLHSE